MISDKAKNKLLKHHGLDADKNTDNDVDAAIKNSYSADEIEGMENRNETLEEQLAEQAVQADLEKYANRIGKDQKNIDRWKAALIANREMAVEMLEAIPEPAGTVKKERTNPVHVPNRAGSPDKRIEDQNTQDTAKLRTAIRNRASELTKQGVNEQEAFLRADRQVREEMDIPLQTTNA